MSWPRLEMHQQGLKIDWNVLRPSYTFQPGKAEVQISQTPAKMTLNPTPSRLSIDQSECWADMDLKHISRRIAEEAADGKRAVLEYIGKTAEEGTQLRSIEHKGDVLRNLAMQARIMPEYNIQYSNVPENFSLRIDVLPGELNMDWQRGGVNVDVKTIPYSQNYEMGKIDYYVKQKNELTIDVVGSSFDALY